MIAAQMATAVQVAFSLGWTMADLYEQGLPDQARSPEPREHLPGIGRLSPSQRALLRLDQVDAALSSLSSLIVARGLGVPRTDALRVAQQDETPKQEKHKAIYALHLIVLRRLTAVDYRLGKAYGLGRALADTCHEPKSHAALARRFGRDRLDNLRGWLNDLASALPEHSARAVLAGLARWEAWVANLCSTVESEDSEPAKQVKRTLRRQGELWRAVLSGEKDARDMLSVDSYLKAADSMAQRAFALARTFLRRPVLAVPLLLLVAASIGLLIWGVTSGGASQLTASVLTAAAALGITWKTVGATAQKLGEALEKPLWGAAIDAAVGEALTYLPLVPVVEPRADVLLDAPRLLHETYVSKGPRGRARLRQRLPEQERRYLLNWAKAAGYVEAQTGERGDASEHLSHEGRRLAEIPPGEHGSVRAALSAGRGIAPPSAPVATEEPEQDAPETTTAIASDGEETR